MIESTSHAHGGPMEAQPLVIFTTVARNYLGQASVLSRSIKQHCAGAVFRCFVTDGFDDDEVPQELKGDVRDCRTLDIPGFEQSAFKYSVTEFATSLKPHIFQYLFAREHYDRVMFIDPDTRLYSDTLWVEEALRKKSILLTPHVLDYRPYDAHYTGRPSHFDLVKLQAVGVYNTGFVAVRNDVHGVAFLRWWADVLKDHCFQRHTYDQKWVEFVPVFFGDHFEVVRDPGANVAYWNLHERTLTKDGDQRYFVNGVRLKFMHFTKIDKLLGVKQSRDDRREHSSLVSNPEYAELYESYIADLIAAGFQNRKEQGPYRYDYFDNGMPVSVLHRRAYANLLRRGESLPNPFDASGRFYGLLRAKGLVASSGGAGMIASKAVFGLIDRILGSEWPFRALHRILGAGYYLALLRRVDRMARHEGESMRWMFGEEYS